MQLIGYVDGQEIRFDFRPPSSFTATLPQNKTGVCIVELHAIDDAGNMSAYCDSVVMIDFDRLSVRAITANFINRQHNGNLFMRAVDSGFTYKELI